MGAFVAVAAVAVIVFVIAAIAIGRETHRLDAVAPTPTVELNDAVSWISERLPESVLAQVSYEDVRDVVTTHVELLTERGVREVDPSGEPELVVDESIVADEIMLRLLSKGRDLDPTHIGAIVTANFAYFDAIGAIGPQATPEDPT